MNKLSWSPKHFFKTTPITINTILVIWLLASPNISGFFQETDLLTAKQLLVLTASIKWGNIIIAGLTQMFGHKDSTPV